MSNSIPSKYLISPKQSQPSSSELAHLPIPTSPASKPAFYNDH